MCYQKYCLRFLLLYACLLSIQGLCGEGNQKLTRMNISGAALLPALKLSKTNIATFELKGHVFHDADGISNHIIDHNQTGTGINLNGNLSIVLARENGEALLAASVSSSGAYSFSNVAEGIYLLILTNQQVAAGSYPKPSLPENWVNVGEQIGETPSLGIDAEADGKILVSLNSQTGNVNFGIQQPPTADAKAYFIPAPFQGQVIRLNGTLPGAVSSPNQLTGQDPEDARNVGGLNGNTANRKLIITSLPEKGVLMYAGMPVAPHQVIDNYDKNELEIKIDSPSFSMIDFAYSYYDAAGSVSPSRNYVLNWITNTPLPVKLESFLVSNAGGEAGNLVKWSTSSEENADRFAVERSENGLDWKTLGEVVAKGESKLFNSYSFSDIVEKKGTYYYRLKMIDMDGTFTYSTMKSILVQLSGASYLYPNPAVNVIHLKTEVTGVKKAIFFDASGSSISSTFSFSDNMIDVSQLPAGKYFVKITDQKGVTSQYKATISR